MFIRKGLQKPRRGFTLVETMVACALFSIAGIALGFVYLYSTRAFATMTNYAQLDQNNRLGMDKMTKEIRESRLIMSATTNSAGDATVTILNNVGETVTFTFDSALQALTRVDNGNPPQILIPNCQNLKFEVGQRTPTNSTATFDNYPPLTTNDMIQVITLTWRAWKSIPGTTVGTSEEIQSAHVVVRNQHFMQNNSVAFSQ